MYITRPLLRLLRLLFLLHLSLIMMIIQAVILEAFCVENAARDRHKDTYLCLCECECAHSPARCVLHFRHVHSILGDNDSTLCRC